MSDSNRTTGEVRAGLTALIAAHGENGTVQLTWRDGAVSGWMRGGDLEGVG